MCGFLIVLLLLFVCCVVLKSNAMSQLGLNPDDAYGGSAGASAGGVSKKSKLEDGSSGMGSLDYSALDPAQLELLQQQQQYMQQYQQQQQQLAAGMQQVAAMAGGGGGSGSGSGGIGGELQTYQPAPQQVNDGSSGGNLVGAGTISVPTEQPSAASSAKAKNDEEEEEEEEEQQ